MSMQQISIDRREAYYKRTAKLVAQDPLGYYARAEAGRKIQNALRPNLTLAQLIRRAELRQCKENGWQVKAPNVAWLTVRDRFCGGGK